MTKKVHHRTKLRYRMGTTSNGAKVLRELRRKAATRFAKIGKKNVAKK